MKCTPKPHTDYILWYRVLFPNLDQTGIQLKIPGIKAAS